MRLSLFTVAAAFALASTTLAATAAPDANANASLTAGDAHLDFEEVVDDDGTLIRVFHSGGDPLGEADEDLDNGAAPARRSTHKQIAAAKRSKKTKAMAGHYTVGPVGNHRTISKKVQITWYGRNDLKNPQCGDGTWDPDNNDHIGAVMAGWDNGPKCGEFVQLCNPAKQNRCITVRVVDKCAGCSEDAVDLTQSAFRLLSPSGTLDEGRIHNIVLATAEKPTSWDFNLFGPVRLGGPKN